MNRWKVGKAKKQNLALFYLKKSGSLYYIILSIITFFFLGMRRSVSLVRLTRPTSCPSFQPNTITTDQ